MSLWAAMNAMLQIGRALRWRSDQPRRRQWGALLAVLFLGVFASLQVAHGHLPGGAEDSHCAFCLASHTVAAVVAPPALPTLVQVRTEPPAAVVQVPSIAPSISLFIRPPPVDCSIFA